MFSVQYGISQTYSCNFNNLKNDIWIGVQTIDTNHMHSGNLTSVTNSEFPYGLGVEMPFPEGKKGENTLVTVSGRIRSSAPASNALYVVTANQNGKECFWRGIHLDTLIKTSKQWYRFSGSCKFPASVTRSAIFKCYLWNAGGNDTVAMEDLSIDFEQVKNPIFLPGMNFVEIRKTSNEEGKYIYTNPFYSIRVNSSGNIIIQSRTGRILVDGLFAISILTERGVKVSEHMPFVLKNKHIEKEITKIVLTANGKYSSKTLSFICRNMSPNITATVVEKYKKKIQCHRSSIVFKSGQEVSEVYRANRKSDTGYFQKEYWLGREGVQFGRGENSWLIYHVPGVSSLQIAAGKNLLVVNLDYEKDHPFLHFPLSDDTIDYKQDWSSSIYKRGDKRVNKWYLSAGINTENIPRLMKNPEGYLATYIWTEHADFTDIRTNRATYFGSEKISRPEDAVGGFVKYNIPVTKSVFYDNPDRVNNAKVSDNIFTGLECAILTDTAFSNYLEQIKNVGTEICLHTPEQFSTTKPALASALAYTKEHFHSVSWIDHGYNNHSDNNREDLMCDGLLKISPYYAARLWKKYGVKYFWNAYYEDFFTFAGWKFGNFLESYYPGYGDFMPKPDYWRHPTRSGNLIHWPTSTVLYVSNDAMWGYFFNEQILKDFVRNWSVEISHCYPAWVDPKKGFWTYKDDSTIVARPGFNKTLQQMARFRDKHLLNVTTIKSFLDYQLLLKKVDYELLPDGRIKITNMSGQDIKGLAFATKAGAVLVDRLKPAQKNFGNDLIFWFDIKAGDSRIIRTVD